MLRFDLPPAFFRRGKQLVQRPQSQAIRRLGLGQRSRADLLVELVPPTGDRETSVSHDSDPSAGGQDRAVGDSDKVGEVSSKLTFSSEGEKNSLIEGRKGPYRIRRGAAPVTSLCESKLEKMRRGPSGLRVSSAHPSPISPDPTRRARARRSGATHAVNGCRTHKGIMCRKFEPKTMSYARGSAPDSEVARACQS